MSVGIGFRANLKPLHRSLSELQAKQVPFALSLAINALAKGVAADERALVDQTFDTPTPFTENAYRIEVATKRDPVARVMAKDIQAAYLAPYVIGGQRSLGGKRGMLAPRGVTLNRYGNLTRGKMAALKSKPNVFICAVRTKKGATINGVWQRPTPGKKGKAGGLKLLIAFEDTTPVRKRLPFEQRARAYVAKHAGAAFDAAMQQAMASARLPCLK